MGGMDAEILTIGSELLSGATVNTNAAYLAERMGRLGIACRRQTAVPDGRDPIVQAVREALGRCDLLLLTGGLGPTFDDLTMAAVAEAVRRPLRRNPAAAARVRRFYRLYRRTRQRMHHGPAVGRGTEGAALRQADLPSGAQALPNPLGSAPGMWLPLRSPRSAGSPRGPLLIALPGVPDEMRLIMERSVLPRLGRIAAARRARSRTLRTIGVVELDIERVLRRLRVPRELEIGLYPHLHAVDVRITAAGPAARGRTVRLVERRLRTALGKAVYGTDADTLAGVVGAALAARQRTVAVAESCTGGMIAASLTDVPGSSAYVLGGIVAYADRVKSDLLGVPRAVLARHGAISAATARSMARQVRAMMGADYGMSATGIAGPSGGRPNKPVGLVYVGLSDAHRTRARAYRFSGGRARIRALAVQAALDWLRRELS